MTEATTDLYLARFAEFEKAIVSDGQAWTQPLRRAALAQFAALGFPTTRLEEWKYTNVAPIARTPFQLAPRRPPGQAAEALAAATIAGLTGPQLVFVNGHYAPELSTLRPLPPDVQLTSLAEALASAPHRVEPHLARYASYEQQAFVALNTAFMQDGVFLFIPDGRLVAEPIHLVFIALPEGEATVSYPRNLIVLGEGAQAAIVESYIGQGPAPYLTDSVTEIVLGPNAVAEHCKLEWESPGGFHVATLQVQQGRSSQFTSHSLALGGALVRNDLNVELSGEGSETTLNGLFMGADQQHIDNHTRVDHAKPHGSSRELYKGILAGKARGVFNGKIVVHKDAQKTDAAQTNKNLLLSADASVDTKPQLEILNNDVKCYHGSTIGRLEDTSIFYLRSRGLDLEAARSLLTYAFASEIIGRIKHEPIRARLDRFVLTWLPRSQRVKETL
jgi:Fe-S cluster assembly protein SufD